MAPQPRTGAKARARRAKAPPAERSDGITVAQHLASMRRDLAYLVFLEEHGEPLTADERERIRIWKAELPAPDDSGGQR